MRAVWKGLLRNSLPWQTSQSLGQVLDKSIVWLKMDTTGGQLMNKRRPLHMTLEEVELLQWALYQLNRGSLNDRQLETLESLAELLIESEKVILGRKR